MLDIFDILGPVMVGPSSSHTAGAVRIGNMARVLLGSEPATAEIYLHGSFAETGRGHGTDRALIAGLLGLRQDDMEIPNSFQLAMANGLEFHFHVIQLREAHPNTVIMELTGRDGRRLKLQACSTGGGRIRVDRLDDIPVGLSGEHHTLIIYNQDEYGFVGEVTTTLSAARVNIANMRLRRQGKGALAIMVIETDQPISPFILQLLQELHGIQRIVYYQREDE